MKRLESHGKRGPATVNLQDKEAISHRNKALWSIVAQVHEKRGIEPVESDVELNARLSLEMARLFALPRLESEVIRRRAKYFAASTLFLMRDHDVASSETLPQFIARVLGPEFLEELTSEDLQVVTTTGQAAMGLRADEPLQGVHDGNTAMACMLLLCISDPSFKG